MICNRKRFQKYFSWIFRNNKCRTFCRGCRQDLIRFGCGLCTTGLTVENLAAFNFFDTEEEYTCGQPFLSWDTVPEADSYEIYEGETLLATVTNTEYQVSEATNASHTYTVIALTNTMPSHAANVTVVVVPCELEGLVALNEADEAYDCGNPRLHWEEVDGATEYKIYHGATLLGTTALLDFEVTGQTAGSKTFTVNAYIDGIISNTDDVTVVIATCP
jgi:fibronectin type 3 domain-containing protein